ILLAEVVEKGFGPELARPECLVGLSECSPHDLSIQGRKVLLLQPNSSLLASSGAIFRKVDNMLEGFFNCLPEPSLRLSSLLDGLCLQLLAGSDRVEGSDPLPCEVLRGDSARVSASLRVHAGEHSGRRPRHSQLLVTEAHCRPNGVSRLGV